uniref:EF-hand domain-containing protein n=1 Tax=Romanomermis culicivorax TaxID=13658 RepID=A0A915KI59_ROMCU
MQRSDESSDPAETIVGAFKIFDKRGTGFIDEQELLKVLRDKRFGEPFSDAETDAMYAGKPPIVDGKVDYNAFVKLITTGAQEELSKT